ncbi:hypothetical protein OUZ56_029658 [Daphnia magna]|uniref:Uncharacterized protein n=1 Tax=Daphnia magna TaxID=35525 RepID=A0ABR0B7G1_9CRUS|nr:hypothetical protein OUZ56_029658 [Daphnia magna]
MLLYWRRLFGVPYWKEGANVGYNQKVQRAMMQRAQRRAELSNPAFVAEATAMLAANDRYRKALGTDIFLIAYVMMTGKVESLYDLVFDQMVRKLNTLIPGDNTSVRLMGCSEGLQVAYARPNEQNIVKLLIPIALLPSKSALEGFELIRTNSVALLEAEGEVVKEAFPRIFEYFQNYWTVILKTTLFSEHEDSKDLEFVDDNLTFVPELDAVMP